MREADAFGHGRPLVYRGGMVESLPQRFDNRRTRHRLNTDQTRKFRDQPGLEQILEAAIGSQKERALPNRANERPATAVLRHVSGCELLPDFVCNGLGAFERERRPGVLSVHQFVIYRSLKL